MEHLANLPITILVKAPNQKIGDQTVECFMDWTVRKLKTHLSTVYPNRPDEMSQRIIYSGKLLQDSSLLKDVLRTDDSSSFHTVHLVCKTDDQADDVPCRPVGKSSPTPSGPSTPSNVSSSSSRRTSVSDSTTGGVRQRHPRRSDSTASSPGTPSTPPYMPQQFSVPGSPTAYQNMSPQQLQWMQHMYMQQMAAAYYMQYHSGSSSPGLSPPWTPPAGYQFPQQVAQPAPMPNAPVANQPAPFPGNNIVQPAAAEVPREAPRVQNQQMNAGVGPAINDEEEEGANRDWLDWIYTLCRFSVLLSIVYFYSSMNRFLLVAGVMFVIYLYENNFFRLRRRIVARVPEEEAAPPRPEEGQPRGEEAPEAVDRPDGGQDTDGTTPGDDPTTTTTDDENSPEGDGETTNEDTPAPEEPKPSLIRVLWVFVTMFFTSLVPQGPQHLNAN